MNSNELSQLSPKALKEYINAYHLPFKTAIEKSDLVRIIFNTKPISNQNEMYYRTNRTKPTVSSVNNDSDGGFFSSIVHDLFTSPTSNNQEQEQQQQRQHREQEQRREQERRSRQEAERERLDRERREQFLRQQQQQQQQQHQQRYTSNTPSPAPSQRQQQQQARHIPVNKNENILSLHDMVNSKIDPASLSVRTLKSILKSNFVEQSHVIEKSELVKLVIRLADQHKAETNEGGNGDHNGNSNDDSLCRICFDAQQNCVFLDCGHMVTCMDCAKKVK